MMVVVSYDVSEEEDGEKRLRKVAKICKNYGQRVQYSVFECVVTPDQWVKLRNELESVIDHHYDSLRYYYLGSNWQRRIEKVGKQKSYDPEEPLIL